ncbi:MAG: C10 family peptidase [Bacteroidaceae bacterium]|nr:C10 family peptidase [Bacteroidaceae bacterium]
MCREGRVLAHSLNFNPQHITDDMPPALQEILRAYQKQPRYSQRTKGRAVEPLLKSIRHQSDPFNRSCPYYTDDEGKQSDERCIVGCVATCIEQVLSYYHYPEVLLDTLYGWETEHYSIENILPGTRIDWEHILNDYRGSYTDEQAKAVSDLSLYCGMAAHMSWGLSSSGASVGRACEPLARVFGYKTIVYLYRGLYTSPKWNRLLRNELEQGRPICYTGHNIGLGGHAFNIDGVDEDGYYHLNWGYGGDYDGYFDLDYLNPFEMYADPTHLGQQEGLFSNQTALLLHPDEIDINVSDSLLYEDAFAGVTVDDVRFRRPPDTQEYTIADFIMTNHTQDSLNFTFEVLTFLPTDTAIFKQADYVALSAVNLAPGEKREWPVYCLFSEAGERILSFSPDDETLPFQMPVVIAEGTKPVLKFSDVNCQQLRYGDNLVADLSLDVTNEAKAGYAGNLITFCLFPNDEPLDQRHWEVLNLPASSTQRLSTRFQHLTDGTTYTFKVRCPWEVQSEYIFTARFSEATDGIENVPQTKSSISDNDIYDISGRRVSHPIHGIYIKNGKKTIVP